MSAARGALAGRRVLVTGIHHRDLSPAAARYLDDARAAFETTVREQLGGDVPALGEIRHVDGGYHVRG